MQLIQPTLNKNEIRVKNSTSFVNEANTWPIAADEIQVSYDVTALYPSVPVRKAIDAMMEILKSDFDDVMVRSKLTLSDIRILLELCLSKCYFLWNNCLYEIEDAGPIGLSLMVVIAEGYLQYLERMALNTALARSVCPSTYRRYVDDSHARFGALQQAHDFMEILNDQDPCIQYTMETEQKPGELSFLDVTVINDKSGRYQFNVHRKDAIINIQIKPHSSISPRIITGVFKGFLARAQRICSDQHLHAEI